MRSLAAFAALLVLTLSHPLSAAQAQAQDTAREETLYRIALIRAAPGYFELMLSILQGAARDGFYADAGRAEPVLMRHIQGDHWDLMLIEPAGSLSSFFAEERLTAERAAHAARIESLGVWDAVTAFEQVFFVWGPSAEDFAAHIEGAGLYHIEMFNAAPDRRYELIYQRGMENDYLQATGRRANLIFVTEHGSDVDVITLGAHRDLAAFAAPPAMSDEELEAAAIAAGFQSRSHIGFYLRELISSHRDTFAVSVP